MIELAILLLAGGFFAMGIALVIGEMNERDQ